MKLFASDALTKQPSRSQNKPPSSTTTTQPSPPHRRIPSDPSEHLHHTTMGYPTSLPPNLQWGISNLLLDKTAVKEKWGPEDRRRSEPFQGFHTCDCPLSSPTFDNTRGNPHLQIYTDRPTIGCAKVGRIVASRRQDCVDWEIWAVRGMARYVSACRWYINTDAMSRLSLLFVFVFLRFLGLCP